MDGYEGLGVAASPPGHSDEPASSLAADAGSVPNAICGYPLPGWRLDKVEWSEIHGQPDGWIVSLKRTGPEWHAHRAYIAMARSDLGPLEAWDEALRIALRGDHQAAEDRNEQSA